MSSILNDLGKQVRKARENENFFETDLRLWKTKLEELKIDIADIYSRVTVDEDPFIALVAPLRVRSIHQRADEVKSTNQPYQEDERLVSVYGCAQIDENGCIAVQRDSTTISYIRGKNEYLFGKYKIRFKVEINNLNYAVIFGIVSKMETYSTWPSSFHGWSSDDTHYCGEKIFLDDQNVGNDLRGQISFAIEFLLNCDHQKIQYFNEQTKNMREININMKDCPFPWQVFFYLHSAGDRIRLLY